ncbi:MAG: hypothetical protein Ta2E_01740 [Mycoplasmoidaceae bacterium]|nr:MAG: hypothetical protein Ta2E_01740 [Mycoplasmoidaceae bacterium]
MLIVCNEYQSIDNAKHINTDCIKTLITDNICTIQSKYLNTRTIGIISRFIFVANNFLSITIENLDRRYVVRKSCEASKILWSFENNFEYFEKQKDSFTASFYINLHAFFKSYDIIQFNPRTVPAFDIKMEITEACKESW